ncbi:hypothetical protein HanIR_Chr03g0106501 [Helianthus annuus]|nr:hypothetical protein HanIR_Chr03g0106501 [Helianthus annuus]
MSNQKVTTVLNLTKLKKNSQKSIYYLCKLSVVVVILMNSSSEAFHQRTFR